MTGQFREGQEVQVRALAPDGPIGSVWRKAKISYLVPQEHDLYEVWFRDGSRAVFDAKHIRRVP
jgi:hypothetical protein